jgi:endonuclease-3
MGGASSAGRIVRRLLALYPHERPRLDFRSAFELMVATVLAAQCTDEQVNRVTPALFAKYPDPASLAAARLSDLERLVHSTGFFRQKARNLKRAAGLLVERFGGAVPRSIEELATLPGVGRKTANVVAGLAFGGAAIIVDTHFRRVVQRLGLAAAEDPDRIESELRALVPAAEQTRFSMAANAHGRLVCRARSPLCGECPLEGLCPWPGKPGRPRGKRSPG